MARRYYRSRVRYIRPKKKWATNIKRGEVTRTFESTTGVLVEELVSNSTQSNTPTPVIVKTGNFKVSLDASLMTTSDVDFQGPNSFTAYVVFVPQGVFPPLLTTIAPSTVNGLLNDHPEYIMAWRKLDTNAVSSNRLLESSQVTFSSRLKRNLNSGDRVCLVLVSEVGYALGTSPNLMCSYVAQYWTCAN